MSQITSTQIDVPNLGFNYSTSVGRPLLNNPQINKFVGISLGESVLLNGTFSNLLRRILIGVQQTQPLSPINATVSPVMDISVNKPQTNGQILVDRAKAISGLTNEELAPLCGVSRRSLQSWIAGEALSKRNETRIRQVISTVEAFGCFSSEAVRDALLSRKAYSVRSYDLIREGRFQSALDLVTNRKGAAELSSNVLGSTPKHLDLLENVSAISSPTLDMRFSKISKR
jgi:hypothetical protein